ncbi:MAG: SigB/SigF/SigG family RNA polymerase sigma factor [Armatimonadota bacterium]
MPQQESLTETADRLWAAYAENRDPAVREALIYQFKPLAHRITSRFLGRGVPEEDLEQVAMIGLILAVDRFDPRSGYRFATFATPTIIGEIKRHFRDHYWRTRVPRSISELYVRIAPAQAQLTVRLGRQPLLAELAEELRVTEEELVEAMAVDERNRMASFHREYADDDENPTDLEDVVGTHDAQLTHVDHRICLEQIITCLPRNQREVLRLRFLTGMSQRAVGQHLGISQMHVCRLEQRALAMLRRELISGQLTVDSLPSPSILFALTLRRRQGKARLRSLRGSTP